ncbi:hypothetical protein LCGC14_2136120, partial [marine sediment metagenome]
GSSSTDPNPTHIFRNEFGPDNLVFNTRLIAISPYYCRDTSSFTITVRPYIEAKFAFDTAIACSPHQITITDQSIQADSYYWDFGDGDTSTSAGPILSKVFTNTTNDPVTYKVKLRVENEEGCFDTLSRNLTIYPELTGSFNAVPSAEGCSPFDVTFQNSSTGSATYFWDFGDGGSGSGKTITRNYQNPGEYTVTLSITADHEETASASASVIVNTPPTVEIISPGEGEEFTVGDQIECTGTATDAEDGDLTDKIQWAPPSPIDTSGLKSKINSVTLSGPPALISWAGESPSGNYTTNIYGSGLSMSITASVTDSHGASASDNVTVDIRPADLDYHWSADPERDYDVTISGSDETVSITFEAPRRLKGYKCDIIVKVTGGDQTVSDSLTVTITKLIIVK